MKQMQTPEKQVLSLEYDFQVPFYDLDGIQMVWHGNYVKYMEDAREKFGAKYGFEYLHIFNSGYLAPVADMRIKYRNSARISEVLTMKITYVPSRAAKMVFEYLITRKSDNAVIIEAETSQLFVTREGVFEVSTPGFYAEWKKRWNII
ncbi:MAG: acyl-CoA thioesterase [Bacteroidales bacterium]|jgi:acyl-CoA thioester hydrolase|nr:acyl-CoA thioesterase [Bacteroidales bacterium]MBQ5539692.1 acyl-CoA thioesterase [Bacteroidales bacterium]MBR4677057.1 acyl-CoA thioesterase [Bacteroidales bacterium]MEE3447203.1 thioesterase family protein [Bacteroidales bacterium]